MESSPPGPAQTCRRRNGPKWLSTAQNGALEGSPSYKEFVTLVLPSRAELHVTNFLILFNYLSGLFCLFPFFLKKMVKYVKQRSNNYSAMFPRAMGTLGGQILARGASYLASRYVANGGRSSTKSGVVVPDRRKRRSVRSVLTQTKRKPRRDSYAMTGPGKTAGFLYTRKRVTKKARQKAAGFNFTGEYGGIGTSANVGVIGHVSMPIAPLMIAVWGAVIKKLLEKAGLQMDNMTDTLVYAGGLNVNDTIVVGYQVNEASSEVSTVVPIAAATSLGDLAAYCGNGARGWISNTSVADQTRFLYVQLNLSTAAGVPRTVAPCVIRLDEMMCMINSKSALKLQNRTVVGAGDDEADVNSQPIYGKSYAGLGQGSNWRDVFPATFQGSQATGIISGDDGTWSSLKEPPELGNMKNVKRSGKIKLDSGEIKTSVLVSKRHIKFNDLFALLYPIGVGITAFVRKPIGEYRFFAYEKMLDTGAVYNIVLAFEHNLDIEVSVRTNNLPHTLKYYEETKNLTY